MNIVATVMAGVYYMIGGGSGDTTSSLISSQFLTDIGTLLTQIWTWITGNAYLALFLTMALVFMAMRIFKGLKKTAR